MNTPDRDYFLRSHAEPLMTLNEIQNRSLEKALKGTEENLDTNSNSNVISKSEREEIKSELERLDVAGEAWKPSGTNKSVPSPPKYNQTVLPARKNVMFTDDGEMIVIEKKGTANKRGPSQTSKVVTIATSEGNPIPVHTPRSTRNSGIPAPSKTPPRPPAPPSSSTVKPNTLYSLTPLSTPVQSNIVGSPGRTPVVKTPGSIEGVIDKLDRMASILESQFKMFQSQQQQPISNGIHAHAGPIRKGSESGSSFFPTPTSRRHLHPNSPTTSLPATPLMSPVIARGSPHHQQQRFEMTPQAEQQFEMANGISFAQFMGEFNDLKQQVLAQTPAKGHREGGNSLLPTSSKQKSKYLEERRQAGQKAKQTSSVSRKASDLKSEKSEVDDINSKPWYQRRAYAKTSIEDTMQRSNSPSKEETRDKRKDDVNDSENCRYKSVSMQGSPSKQQQASSPSPGRHRGRSNSIDRGQTLTSTSPSPSLVPSNPEPFEKTNLSTGLLGRRSTLSELPHGVTEIPIKSSLSSVSNGKGSSSSRRVGDVENNLPSNASTIESLKLKLNELSRQLEEAERTELFDGNAGIMKMFLTIVFNFSFYQILCISLCLNRDHLGLAVDSRGNSLAHLNVKVLNAKNLPAMKMLTKSTDAYCEIMLTNCHVGEGKLIQRTSTVWEDLYPKWNESITFKRLRYMY